MPATVLLDLYGTLVEPDWVALLHGRATLAERAGVPADAARRAWDATHEARMVGAFGSLSGDLAAVFAEAKGRSREFPPGLLSRLADEELENWSLGVQLYADVVPGLELLRATGSRLAIVTNASAEAASVVDTFGLRPLVDDVVASCEAGVLKPDLLEVALGRLGAVAADATLVDDEPEQLEAAAGIGIGTILIQRGTTEVPVVTPDGLHAITDLRQVAERLSRAAPAQQR